MRKDAGIYRAWQLFDKKIKTLGYFPKNCNFYIPFEPDNTASMKLNIKSALFVSALFINICVSAQTYNDGPMTLEIRVTGLQVDYHPDLTQADDVTLGNLICNTVPQLCSSVGSLSTDELSCKVWARANPDLTSASWLGGACIQADLAMSVGGPENYVYAPQTVLLNIPFGAQVPKFFDLKIEGWEDEKPADFDLLPSGIPFVLSNDCQSNDGFSRCVYDGNNTNCITVFGISTLAMEDDLYCNADPFQTALDYRAAGPPCRWNSHGYVIGNCPSNNYYRPQIESRYRFSGGVDCPTALDLGTIGLGDTLRHFNSTECYNNTFSGSPGNDAFYKFTINNPIGITISTCSNTFFDTYVYLLYNGCAITDIDGSNDDGTGCGTQSRISKTLCRTGTYYVIVDGKAATDFGPFELVISEDPALTFAAIIDTTNPTKWSNPSCFGYNDGLVEVDIIGGTDPFTISWSNGYNDTLNTGLAAGTYAVTVTDFSGCQATASTTLRDPDSLTVTVATTDLTCSGQVDGTAKATVVGGVTPYRSFTWNTGLTGDTLSNLAAGIYSVTVSDFEFCTATASDTVSANNPIVITVDNVVDVRCNGEGNGAIYITASGGLPGGYSYVWDPNVSTAASATNLMPGVYQLSVYDNTGNGRICYTPETFLINEPQPLVSTIAGVQNNICFGGATGGVDLEVSGGTLNYAYSWTDGSTRGDLFGSPAGAVSVTVTDANGCTVSSDAVITEPSEIIATAAADSAGCYGTSSGSVDLEVSGGIPNYSYIWSNNGETTQDISGLEAGNYQVAITDANGCTKVVNVPVHGFQELEVQRNVTNPSCIGKDNGSISLTVSGASPFSYSWSDGSTDSELKDLAFGSYTVTVTDFNGCTAVVDATVAEPTANCEGGTFDVAVPNAFSPNGDDYNGTFDIWRDDNVSKVSVKIYNRWGELVYEKSDQPSGPGNGWDGTVNGKDAQVGSYVYVMEIEYHTPPDIDRPTQRTGTVALLR